MTIKRYDESNNSQEIAAANLQVNKLLNYHIKSSLDAKPFDFIKEHFFNERVEKLLSKVQLYEFTDKKLIMSLIRGNKEVLNLLNK